jgi:hypothetical protein
MEFPLGLQELIQSVSKDQLHVGCSYFDTCILGGLRYRFCFRLHPFPLEVKICKEAAV